ncbi:hypothetical protein Y694_03504 [Methylibium sp. T29-B]|nr:hypothetical protein Y694_03504 [Methylibium sp. T29-B]
MKWPRSEKRSPHSAGGVASSRSSWRRTPLRTTRSTASSDSGGAPRSSSVHTRVPPWITNSCWLKNQSVAAPSSPGPDDSSPATRMRPRASRRTSSRAPSTRNWSKRNRQRPSQPGSRDDGDNTARTLGRRSASRGSMSCCGASYSTTSRSSMERAQRHTEPPSVTSIAPMRTGTPKAWLTRISMSGRQCRYAAESPTAEPATPRSRCSTRAARQPVPSALPWPSRNVAGAGGRPTAAVTQWQGREAGWTASNGRTGGGARSTHALRAALTARPATWPACRVWRSVDGQHASTDPSATRCVPCLKQARTTATAR